MYQQRSYVLALENAPDVNGMYVDESSLGMSFRNYNGLLLLGGGSHRTGKHGSAWGELSAFSQTHYPASNEICRWAAQDCMTLDAVPYIGVYSKSTPNLYVASGFNKWGMTSSMAAAEILTDLILDRQNPYGSLFTFALHSSSSACPQCGRIGPKSSHAHKPPVPSPRLCAQVESV